MRDNLEGVLYVDADGHRWGMYGAQRCQGCDSYMAHLIRSEGEWLMCLWCKHTFHISAREYIDRI